jgi:hypothetical protein
MFNLNVQLQQLYLSDILASLYGSHIVQASEIQTRALVSSIVRICSVGTSVQL